MNKLSKEKRDRLILVMVGTAVVLAVIYFLLIKPQYDNLSKINNDIKAALDKQVNNDNTIKKSASVTATLSDVSLSLSRAESDMASGDTYIWTYDTISRFKAPYKLDIPAVGQPTIGNVDLIGDFPYKQLKFNVNGTAYYHDFGKFIANFENTYPHFRIVNLSMSPLGGIGEDAEKLSFRIDIIALTKSGDEQK